VITRALESASSMLVQFDECNLDLHFDADLDWHILQTVALCPPE
jgi:hypothetical protein